MQLSTGGKAQSQFSLFKKIAVFLFGFFLGRKHLFELGVLPESGLHDLTFIEPVARTGTCALEVLKFKHFAGIIRHSYATSS